MSHPAQTSTSLLPGFRPLTLGVVTGMRSLLPLALLATEQVPAWPEGQKPALNALHTGPGRVLACAAAGGEIIADKLPFTPSRIGRGPLAGRVLLGALAGVLYSRERGRSALAGAGAAALGAAAGSFGGYYLRRGLGQASHLPDPVWAVTEDVAALLLGRWVIGMGSGND
jgi:uncharacterized membrane protein